jgi:hypothetical protein
MQVGQMIEKVELLKSRDGHTIVRFLKDGNRFTVGNLYNEAREIAGFLTSIGNPAKNDNYIVFGLGYLNHIRELIKSKFGESKILVIECSQECINLVVNSADDEILETIGNQDLVITSEMESLRLFLEKNINSSNYKNVKVVQYSNYFRYFNQDIQSFYKLIADYLTEINVNNFTVAAFEDDWYQNNIRNLQYANETRTLQPYRNICIGKPAILVSAGPSLDKNISLLKENRDAVIICGGRTLKSLLSIGIDADFVVIYDAGGPSYELVKNNLGSTKARLVYYFGIPTEILSIHKGEKIAFAEDDTFSKLFQEKNVNIGMGGGSVAHPMTNLAVVLGCDPIIFIGQDLAYTNDMEHSQAARSPWRDGDVSLGSEKEAKSLYVDDIYGGKVRTSRLLDLYRRQLERIVSSNDDRRFINCTEGGAHIEGTDVFALREIYNQFPIGRSSFALSEIKPRTIDVDRILQDKQRKYIRKGIELYSEAVRINEDYIKIVKAGSRDTRELEKKLNRIESKIKENNKNILFIDYMVTKILDGFHNSMEFSILRSDTEKEAYLKNLMKSRYLFASMRDKLKDNLKIVEGEKEYREVARFMASLEAPIDDQRIENPDTQNDIGFLAVRENFEDEAFMSYVEELLARFPQIKVKAFYFTREAHAQLKERFKLERRLVPLQARTIDDLCGEIGIYVSNRKGTSDDLMHFIRINYFVHGYVFVKERKGTTLLDDDAKHKKVQGNFIRRPEDFGFPAKGYEQFGLSRNQFLFHSLMHQSGRPDFKLDLNTDSYEFFHFIVLEYIFESRKFRYRYLSFLRQLTKSWRSDYK